MADQSTCLSPLCGITIEESATRCPKCGARMHNARRIRTRGWVLLFSGLFLVLFVGWITLRLSPTLLHPKPSAETGNYTGTMEQARMILLLFASIILFGAFGVANAIYMISTGRQNRIVVIVSMLLAVGLIVLAWLTTRMLK